MTGSRRRGSAALVTLAIVAGASDAAWGQAGGDDFPVERFRLAQDRDGLLDVEWGEVPPHESWDLALWLGTEANPLVVRGPSISGRERVGSIVRYRTAGTLVGSIGLFDRLQLGLELPLVLAQEHGAVPGLQMSRTSHGLGDARVAPKLWLLDVARTHLAIIPSITLPTGSAVDYRGERRVVFAPELVASRLLGALRLSGNLGYRARARSELSGLVVDDEIFARVGGGFRFDKAGGPRVELDLSMAGATGASVPFGPTNRNSLEVAAGAQLAASAQVTGVAAIGVGLNNGFGTPDWRVVVGVRYQQRAAADPDGDGVVGAADRCPYEPEDRDGFADEDGCPDPDNDQDGVPDTCDGAPLDPEDRDGFADADGVPDPDNDGDGVLDVADRCPMTAGAVENHGCPDTDRDGDTVIDRLDNCPEEAGDPANAGCVLAQLVSITRDSLEISENSYFANNDDTILPGSYPLLENVARVMEAHPEMKRIQVEGHTDNRGESAFNVSLSQRRAAAVVQFLVARGVAAERLTARGMGAARPIAGNDTDAGRAANRRVEFHIMEDADGGAGRP